ncbi:MAG TPA: hypothetical protein VJM10_00215, partial [Candidatus Methylomirabilis sp.]|nr:hypothetical protein [Candidatus Methylomirabilis sp.]
MERTGALAAKSLTAEAIRTLCGLDILDAHKLDHVEGVTTPDRLYPYRVVFLDRFSDSLCGELESAPEPGVLVIATSDYRRRIPQARIITDSPRKVFARVVWELFDYLGDVQTERVHPTAKVHLTARLSVGVTVGAGGEIGEGAYLCPNVVVGPNV